MGIGRVRSFPYPGEPGQGLVRRSRHRRYPGRHLWMHQRLLPQERHLEKLTQGDPVNSSSKTKKTGILMAAMLSLTLLSSVTRAAEAKAAPAPAAVAVTDQDFKALTGPKVEDLAQGDPSGAMTGTVNDVAMADPKKG